ncbi:hypothetical protein GOP47_0004838 [Adiantum capillus-veneris]|uniref:Uncharacterized protein n=1 Tax=Adiantum capillus-veneris TaxID=13818 RepID=A0A9D4ZL05_ADICA|nr:hypothetical protein GOP47_0004838 [Adiantum capillus-veneris]
MDQDMADPNTDNDDVQLHDAQLESESSSIEKKCISVARSTSKSPFVDKPTSTSALSSPQKGLVSSKIFEKLSPKQQLLKSKALKKALTFARGLASKPNQDLPAASINFAKQSEEPISDNFTSQLALVPTLRVLCISELFDAITFRFAFEGKVLCKYDTYKIAKANYARHLKADLIDRESKNTITFVVTEVFIDEFVESFDCGEFVRIEGSYVKREVSKDGGTSMWTLYANASTLVVKAESFACALQLYLEHKIRDLLAAKGAIEFAPTIAFVIVKIETSTRADGGDSYRLTIADGPASSDRASLLFVPSRRVDYHRMNLKAAFSQHLSKQVSSMGFGKKVFGSLEIININSLEVEYVCGTCKG